MSVSENSTHHYRIYLPDVDVRATIVTHRDKQNEQIDHIEYALGPSQFGYTQVDWLDQFQKISAEVAKWLADNTNPPVKYSILFSTTIKKAQQ